MRTSDTVQGDSFCDAVNGRGWVAGGLSADGDMSALGETMRPIDQLNSAGLSQLSGYVQPLQDVLDRLAGNASVIQSFADTWQRVSSSVDQVGQQLSAPADWLGDSADSYRGRVTEVSGALHETATVSAAVGTLATTMGQVVAGARRNANDLLTDLVRRLISYVRQAAAAEGGVTPNVLAQATNMINAYQEPILSVEEKLRQTMDNVSSLLGGGSAPVRLAMTRIRPGQRPGTGDFPILEGGGGGRGYGGGPTTSGPYRPGVIDRLIEIFRGKGPAKPIELPSTKPQQQKPWPKREDYQNNRDYGRDVGNALKDKMRPFEGTQLKDGWEVYKVERTVGGTKRVDVMYVNHEKQQILVEDYFTGEVQSLEHVNKGWAYKNEPEIQDLVNKGYKYEYIESNPAKLQ